MNFENIIAEIHCEFHVNLHVTSQMNDLKTKQIEFPCRMQSRAQNNGIIRRFVFQINSPLFYKNIFLQSIWATLSAWKRSYKVINMLQISFSAFILINFKVLL